MNKKVKNWLTLALGVGVLAKGVYGLLSDDDEDDDIECIPEAIENKSKYADMEEVIQENTEDKEQDKND